MGMVEVKVADLIGPALFYAYKKATNKKPTETVNILPAFARFIIQERLGDTVKVPTELVTK